MATFISENWYVKKLMRLLHQEDRQKFEQLSAGYQFLYLLAGHLLLTSAIVMLGAIAWSGLSPIFLAGASIFSGKSLFGALALYGLTTFIPVQVPFVFPMVGGTVCEMSKMIIKGAQDVFALCKDPSPGIAVWRSMNDRAIMQSLHIFIATPLAIAINWVGKQATNLWQQMFSKPAKKFETDARSATQSSTTSSLLGKMPKGKPSVALQAVIIEQPIFKREQDIADPTPQNGNTETETARPSL